jgi:Cu-Zn family superoxide dismutase
VKGTITFRQTEGGVAVTANVTGLEPNSKHGFHVHEFGDPSSDDGSAMGGHYNPEGHAHALPASGDAERHAGDFGNLEADADGNATFNMTFENISLAGKKNPILGRGLIVHEKPDDGGQPTGNAGGRIAQAVIGVAK